MRVSLIFFSIITLLVFMGLLAASFNLEKVKYDGNSFENKFSAFTSAVCKEGKRFTSCKDNVFVNCSGRIFKSDEIISCNDLDINLPQVSAFAVFEKGWKDPRN